MDNDQKEKPREFQETMFAVNVLGVFNLYNLQRTETPSASGTEIALVTAAKDPYELKIKQI